MPRTPEHWERYASLAALVTKECCVCRKGVCQATSRPCDILKPGQPQRGWRSPMSRNPHYVPPYKPRPFEVTSRRQMSKVLRAHAKAEQIRERSGDGRCTWFNKAIWPILPDHLADSVPAKGGESQPHETCDFHKGERTFGAETADRSCHAVTRRLPPFRCPRAAWRKHEPRQGRRKEHTR